MLFARMFVTKSLFLNALLVSGIARSPLTGGGRCRKKDGRPRKRDIVDTAVSAGTFHTLVAAIQAAGLVETLTGDGPFTVFAPNDEAFAKLPTGTLLNLLKPESRENLASILTYHVVAGKVMASDVVQLDSVKTVNGKSAKVSVSEDAVMIDSARVIATDLQCSNGVIHVIDSVIIPSE